MRRLTVRRLDMSSDNGASLMIVLIVMAVLGVLLAGLSTFAATAEIDTLSLGGQAGTVYGAGNGINAAIKGALNDSANWGVATSATNSGACPTLTLPAVGTSPAMTVNCHYWPGSGYSLTTGGTPDQTVTERPPNSPDYAILATASAQTGISIGGNTTTGTLQIDGPVRSNSPLLSTVSGSIDTDNKATLDAGTSAITAHGTCTGPVLNYKPACTALAAVDAGTTGSDNYDTNGNWVTETMPNATDASTYRSTSDISGHCGTSNALNPGIYQDADALNSLIAGCNGIIWFKPGTYYFDFRSTSHALIVANANVHIVGGQLSSTPSTPGSACRTDATTPAATDGVQWVFGYDSRVAVSSGSLDLCPIPTPLTGKRQEISVYGLRHDQTFSASTTALTPTTAVDVGNNAAFTPEGDGRVIDSQSAKYSWPSGSPKKKAAISLGFNLAALMAAVPPGSSVSADLEVKYASTKRSFSGLSLALTDGDGTTTYPYTGTGTCTNSTTSALCQGTTTPATFDQHFALPGGSNPTLSGLNSLTATFSADPVNNNGDTNDFASIDGAILTVTYTPLPFRAQNGCVTLGAGCGGSAATFFSATGSNSNVSFAGTVYAWDGSIDFNLPNEIGVAFQRGGVARTFALHAPASGAVQKVISLPPAQTITIPGLPGTTVSTDRKLTLTAVVTGSSGSGVITAVVDIDPAGKVTILSWNGKPCGSSGCA